MGFAGIRKRLFKALMLSAKAGVALVQQGLSLLTFGRLPPLVSTSVLLLRDSQVLVIERTDGKGYGLPGGFLHLHEKAEDAARREAREETGLEVEVDGVFMVLSGKRRGTLLAAVEIVYHGRITGGQLRGSIEGACRWVDIDTPAERMAFDYAEVLAKLKGMPEVAGTP